MIVRVQSSDGTKRITCDSSESTASFILKVQKAFELPSAFSFSVYKNRDKTGEIFSLERKSLATYEVRNGDILYLISKESMVRESPPCSPSVRSASSSSSSSLSDAARTTFGAGGSSVASGNGLVEDEVDRILSKQTGYIERGKDSKLCHHDDNAKCIHCSPIEPYSEEYLKEHNINHMSFHSYLRKLTGGIDRGKFSALENISCKIKPGCEGHKPWPLGICTKCQPSAITLNRQRYRHVDNITFENASLVERFLNYWKITGQQRIGFLYGRYELFKDVPLGIRATVAAIYEPPQDSREDSVTLLFDEKADLVNDIATSLGLQRVGWIFTDLIAEDLQEATVKHLRNSKSYFLSAQECIMAGHFQNQHENRCRLSPDNYFGSKFVTVCVTGDKNNLIHTEGYQVSNQCMALVRDNCLVPTKDAPELGYVRESSNEQYVPDVFYKLTDKYGNEVTQLARPLPIEYLLLDVPAATPMEPIYTFYANSGIRPFPVENRFLDGHVQDIASLSSYLHQFPADRYLEAMSDFHVLIYIATMDMVPLKDALDPLLEAVKTKDTEMARQWAQGAQWATVEEIVEAHRGLGPPLPNSDNGSGANGGSTAMWTCRHCTFINAPGNGVCEMCSLPQ